jgi:hypothetical protein
LRPLASAAAVLLLQYGQTGASKPCVGLAVLQYQPPLCFALDAPHDSPSLHAATAACRYKLAGDDSDSEPEQEPPGSPEPEMFMAAGPGLAGGAAGGVPWPCSRPCIYKRKPSR